jgi:predicted metal-dependent enzyme (double-stranded beta helix superfamily)
MTNIARLRGFVQAFTRLVDTAAQDEERIFGGGKALLSDLIAHDDWLPAQFAQPHPDRYQQYLLHCDPLERFSVVSFVWGPGHTTPLHDHTVWGMVGVMRGAEWCEEFAADTAAGRMIAGRAHQLPAGAIELVSPRIGDIHRVSNAFDDRVSVSIHVYGTNIGALERHVYDIDSAQPKRLVSGYASAVTPNLWDRAPM